MITSLGSTWTWSDISSNAAFVQITSDIYVVTNTLANNTFKVLKSTNYGETFVEVVSYTFPETNGAFDPAIYYDGSDIHIIGTATASGKVNLLKFTLTPGASPSLTAAAIVVTGSRFRSGYDITSVSGVRTIVTAVLDCTTPDIPGYSLLEIVLNGNNTVASTAVLVGSVPGTSGHPLTTTSVRTGETYGGISLIPNGAVLELYYTAHNKLVTFDPKAQEIRYKTRNALGVWSDSSVLYRYISEYVDDKITVVAYGAERFLSHLFYTQVKGKLKSSLILGFYSADWSWVRYDGKIGTSVFEPTFCIDSGGNARLAYLEGDLVTQEGSFKVADIQLTNLKLTDRPGRYNLLEFAWLRGTRNTVDNLSKWMIIGERVGSNSPSFVSEYNLAPVALITPTTGVVKRGVPFLLDASASYDADLDPLTFTWSQDDPSPSVTLTPNASLSNTEATLYVPKSIGPAARTINVTVQVVDLDAGGVPIHNAPASSASAVLQVEVNTAPTISWFTNPINATRNTIINIEPTIVDAELDALTYSWTQISGTPVLYEYATTSKLKVHLFGCHVLGETLTFQLTVSDAISPPVVSTIAVKVSAIIAVLDQNWFTRMFFSVAGVPSTIAQRNQELGWSASTLSALSTNFFKERTTNYGGVLYQTCVSPMSALVKYLDGAAFYRKTLLPDGVTGILDATMTETGHILVLASSGYLYRYTESGPDNCSDNPQSKILLSSYLDPTLMMEFSVNKVFQNKRVIGIHSHRGLLLIQVRESDFKLESTLLLSSSDYTLYGANKIRFVRFSGVESLRKGDVYVGSSEEGYTPEYYETLFDLDSKSVKGTWDRTNRINQTVNTGEVLYTEATNYVGAPQTPVLSYTVEGDDIQLSWEQVRPDLVSSYDIELSVAGDQFLIYQRVGSGSIKDLLLVNALASPSAWYTIRMRSLNVDGYSPYSPLLFINFPVTGSTSINATTPYAGKDLTTSVNWTSTGPLTLFAPFKFVARGYGLPDQLLGTSASANGTFSIPNPQTLYTQGYTHIVVNLVSSAEPQLIFPIGIEPLAE